MKVLVLFAHPCGESLGAALHKGVVETLRRRGHEVDDCDLYAEGFDPVLSADERRGYHDTASNTLPVADHVVRLRWAEALVLVFPVWNYGFPAILKGYFDRVFLPGVSFDLVDGKAQGGLRNIGRLAAITSYGGTRLKAFLAGDPPRRIVMRVLRGTMRPRARFTYLAHYDMNRSTAESRAAFLAKATSTLRLW